MNFVRVTKIFSFETAHFLLNYDGLCKNIHGHSYNLNVTLGGKPLSKSGNPKDGMVIDFSLLKNVVKETIVDPFDHALLVNNNVPKQILNQLSNTTERLVILPFQPSCENLIVYFAERLHKAFPEGIKLLKLKLYETSSSYAEWCYEDNFSN